MEIVVWLFPKVRKETGGNGNQAVILYMTENDEAAQRSMTKKMIHPSRSVLAAIESSSDGPLVKHSRAPRET